MASTERIRKQVYLLTVEDLNDHPLWEFCPDEEGEEDQDEATVKPSEDKEVSGYSPGVYILASDITFADGTTATGYIHSGEPGDLGCTQPNVITPSGQVNLWLGALRFIPNPQDLLAKAYQILAKDPASVFPVRFRTRPKINGDTMEIVVVSFMGGGDKFQPVAVN